MIRSGLRVMLLAAVLLAYSGCGDEKLPSRDEIPVLKQSLFALEQGLRTRNLAGLDSLLSVDILDIGQDSDSLLRFAYGPLGDFPFSRLGDYDIFFNNELAVINCYIMDSTSRHDRPIKLTYKHDQERWLLNRFQVGTPDSTGGF